MILDLQQFVRANRPAWDELEKLVRHLETNPQSGLSFDETKRFHYLYQRASADLARVLTFAAEPAVRGHLENLVSRAYGEVHRQRRSGLRWSPWRWFAVSFPQVFRRRARAFVLSGSITFVGLLFGALALLFDPASKPVLMGPFTHLLGTPQERVAREEGTAARAQGGGHATFSGQLMVNNIRVSIFAFALGMTWGLGTMVLLFYNGVILGAVIADYIAAGEAEFLTGWLLPHGSIEIPAILIGGQAGFVLASALVGWGSRTPLRARMRSIAPDVATLLGGVAVMLVWAGLVEAFFSQYHEPVVPYAVKIVVGVLELLALVLFLALAGGGREQGLAQGAPTR